MRENGNYCYPTETANRNVSKDVFLVAEVSVMSGEICKTLYIDHAGYCWACTDWAGDRPYPTVMYDLMKATGDAEEMIRFRYQQWVRMDKERNEKQ